MRPGVFAVTAAGRTRYHDVLQVEHRLTDLTGRRWPAVLNDLDRARRPLPAGSDPAAVEERADEFRAALAECVRVKGHCPAPALGRPTEADTRTPWFVTTTAGGRQR